MSAPTAPRRPHRLEAHGEIRIDDYYWLRNRDDPEVTALLTAENAHVDECLSHTSDQQRQLFDEIKGRIKQTDRSAPYPEGTHEYYWRVEEGQEYRVYCRRARGRLDEQAMLDVNLLAVGNDYCDVGGLQVSPDERLLAYAVDTVGRRQYTIRVRDLATGLDHADRMEHVTGNVVWANDNRTLFYSRQHPTTLRSYQIYRHRLGEDVGEDVLVYEERDETFSCWVGKSRSKRYVLVGCYQTLTTEYRYLDADRPDQPLHVFLSRDRGHEYEIDHIDDRFYVRSNRGASNFKLLETDDPPRPETEWREVIPHRKDVLLEGFQLFHEYLVVQERADGLVRLAVHNRHDGSRHEIEFPDPAYDAGVDPHNRVADTTVLRFVYSSLRSPTATYAYDMRTRRQTLLKQDEVVGDFDPSRYRVERLHAVAADGTRVPISLVRRNGSRLDGRAPLLLYGYGAYGISCDAGFQSPRLSLLDRGFVFAIAHVRGGEELGRAWYEAGKLFNKKNTFTDFIACAEHLVTTGYTRPDQLYAMGGSAGGLLIGAVVNMRPDLFDGVVAQVPFVDVLTTMLDRSIPLTTGEYDEWGNPEDASAYRYIRSYSPYDNVRAQAYPHMLVMSGLHDSQVQYWEPTKWVAKLRALRTSDRRLMLKTNMDAGHGGASGRYHRYREAALQYAFLLDLADAFASAEPS